MSAPSDPIDLAIYQHVRRLRHAILIAIAALALFALVGCSADSPPPRQEPGKPGVVAPPPPPAPLPPGKPVTDLTTAKAEVARLRSLLASAEADAIAVATKLDEERRQARVAVVQLAIWWCAGIGALVGLVAGGLWFATIWWSIPVGRRVLGGIAIAGAATAALALSIGESIPSIMTYGPWVLGVVVAGLALWFGWKALSTADTAGGASTYFGEALRRISPASFDTIAASLSYRQDARNQRETVRAIRRKYEPVAESVAAQVASHHQAAEEARLAADDMRTTRLMRVPGRPATEPAVPGALT